MSNPLLDLFVASLREQSALSKLFAAIAAQPINCPPAVNRQASRYAPPLTAKTSPIVSGVAASGFSECRLLIPSHCLLALDAASERDFS